MATVIEVPAANRTVTSKDNMPPIERAKSELDDLKLEAENWLDGAPIENQSQADDVARLLDTARKTRTRFDNERKAEKKPHDDAAKAVDAAWKPVLTECDLIGECAKKATTAWLIKLDDEKRKAEAELRRKAEEAAEEARKLAEDAQSSLDAVRAREEAIAQAKLLDVEAGKAARDKASAKGDGMGRAIGLRTYYRAEVTEHRALLNHIAKTDPAALTAFIDDWAQKAVAAGKRELPGTVVHEDRRAA